MNFIWSFLFLISIISLTIIDPSTILNIMIDSANNVIKLSVELLAIYSIWLGILELVDKTGIANIIAKILAPTIKKIFKTNNETEIKYIALNIASNLLGLGNAATPSGIKAINEIEKNNHKTTFSMLMLVVVNACGLQLFPTTVISLRASAGSLNSTDIIIPTLIATFIPLFLGIILLFLIKKIFKKVDL